MATNQLKSLFEMDFTVGGNNLEQSTKSTNKINWKKKYL